MANRFNPFVYQRTPYRPAPQVAEPDYISPGYRMLISMAWNSRNALTSLIQLWYLNVQNLRNALPSNRRPEFIRLVAQSEQVLQQMTERVSQLPENT